MERIIDYPEATEIANDDYVLLDGVTGGTKKFLAKNLGGDPVKIKYLCYGVCETDDAQLEVNRPLTITQYTDYSEYLSYDSTNNQIEVLQDFEAIIVPWVYCYQVAGGRPQMGLKLNGNWLARALYAENSVGSAGGLAFTMNDYVTANQSYFPNNSAFNAIRMKLSQGDTLSMQKYNDTGWASARIKIYKLCGSTTAIDNFFNSICMLSDTSSATEIALEN